MAFWSGSSQIIRYNKTNLFKLAIFILKKGKRIYLLTINHLQDIHSVPFGCFPSFSFCFISLTKAFNLTLFVLWTLFKCFPRDVGWANCCPQISQPNFSPRWIITVCFFLASSVLNFSSQCLHLYGNSPRCTTVIKEWLL